MEHILHRTLIIRFSSVGDIVLSSLLVRTLRRRFPDCQIDYLVKEDYADLVRHSPHLSAVITFPAGGGLRELARVRRSIRRSQYDLLIDIHHSLRSRLLCFGARNVVRIRKRKIARFFLVRFKLDLYRFFGGAPSVAVRYLEPVGDYGIRDDGNGLELALPPGAARAAQARLDAAGMSDGRPLIALCPTARHATKVWPAERYAAVAAALARETGSRTVLLGGPGDEALCGHVRDLILAAERGAHVESFAGTCSLTDSAAIMDRCALVISNDSGLMHIAAARKRPLVAIFGSTVTQFGFFPFGTLSEVVEHPALACRPCSHIGRPACPKGHFKCMNELDAAQVLAAARRLLAA